MRRNRDKKVRFNVPFATLTHLKKANYEYLYTVFAGIFELWFGYVGRFTRRTELLSGVGREVAPLGEFYLFYFFEKCVLDC